MSIRKRIRSVLKYAALFVYRIGSRFGIQILPAHYYSPLADLRELEAAKSDWAKASSLPGLSWDDQAQVEMLRTVCLPYQKETAGNEIFRKAVEQNYGPGYGYIEAQALHAVIRHFKPGKIIEVGSGVSTYCTHAALERNKEETDKQYSLTCIEPYPSTRLRQMKDIRLIPMKVQTTSFEAFTQLKVNDLLFIDSSHTVKPGGDVNFLVLEILPRLNPGVVVHFHDIYLPYDYPRTVLQSFHQWMETSLLRAFLIHNDKAKVLFCLSYLHYQQQDELSKVFPEYRPQAGENGLRDPRNHPLEKLDQHFPSSIYLQIG